MNGNQQGDAQQHHGGYQEALERFFSDRPLSECVDRLMALFSDATREEWESPAFMQLAITGLSTCGSRLRNELCSDLESQEEPLLNITIEAVVLSAMGYRILGMLSRDLEAHNRELAGDTAHAASLTAIRLGTACYRCTAAERGQTCAVCLNPCTLRHNVRKISRCGHFFHRRCIDQWFCSSSVCPVCRGELPDGDLQA